MITVLCGTGLRHYDGFLFRRAAPRQTSASSIAPFSDTQPITRPRNITRRRCRVGLYGATLASAQDDPALSTHLTLRSRVIGRIPTPDGIAPSRRPSARIRPRPPHPRHPWHHPRGPVRISGVTPRAPKTKKRSELPLSFYSTKMAKNTCFLMVS